MRKRILLLLGISSFTAGAVILGIGVFGYYNQPNDGSQSAARIDAPEFPSIELDGRTSVPYDQLNLPVGVYYYNPPPPPPPSVATAPLQLVIERLGVNAPVVEMGLESGGIPQVPLNGGDVAWYDFSATPGSGSNAVFAGHVNWNRAPAVFGQISKLQAGDTVKLVSLDGRELVYEVYKNYAVDPADPESLKVMAPSSEDIVTLITCGGTWIPNPSERFGGDYTNRTIVQARLVSVSVAAPDAAGGG